MRASEHLCVCVHLCVFAWESMWAYVCVCGGGGEEGGECVCV